MISFWWVGTFEKWINHRLTSACVVAMKAYSTIIVIVCKNLSSCLQNLCKSSKQILHLPGRLCAQQTLVVFLHLREVKLRKVTDMNRGLCHSVLLCSQSCLTENNMAVEHRFPLLLDLPPPSLLSMLHFVEHVGSGV